MKDFNILTIQMAIIHWLSMIRYRCWCYVDISKEGVAESTKKNMLAKKLLFSIYDLGRQIYNWCKMPILQRKLLSNIQEVAL